MRDVRESRRPVPSAAAVSGETWPAWKTPAVLGNERDQRLHVERAGGERTGDRGGDRLEVDIVTERGAPVADGRNALREVDDDARAGVREVDPQVVVQTDVVSHGRTGCQAGRVDWATPVLHSSSYVLEHAGGRDARRRPSGHGRPYRRDAPGATEPAEHRLPVLP